MAICGVVGDIMKSKGLMGLACGKKIKGLGIFSRFIRFEAGDGPKIIL